MYNKLTDVNTHFDSNSR